MQQRQKTAQTPSKPQSPTNAKPAKAAAPVVLDEKALRHVTGAGPGGPNGGW